jgi:Uma2 family endonuclease
MTALLAHDLTSRAAFLSFLDTRPDHETWELIDGEAVMQASPTLTHALIAGDIDRLLNEAFVRARTSLVSIQNAMADLSLIGRGNMYVPDVLVLDGSRISPEQNTTAELLTAVEILSPGDIRTSGELARRIQVKLDHYRRLPSCSVVMLVTQHAPGLRLHKRIDGSWTEERIESLAAEVIIDELGLRCDLRDFYRRTFLARSEG